MPRGHCEGVLRTVHRFPLFIGPMAFQKAVRNTLAMEVEQSTARSLVMSDPSLDGVKRKLLRSNL